MDKPLTPSQQRFVTEYMKDTNATAAARRAGYSETGITVTGSRLLANPSIRNAIGELAAQRDERTQIDADWVLQAAAAVYKRCMQEVSPLRDKSGNQRYDAKGNALYTFNATGAIASLNLIAKHISVRAFADTNVNVNHSGNVAHLLEQLPEEEKQRIRAEVHGSGGIIPAKLH